MSTDRPNLLIVMTDHQRADTVLPEHPCRTPNLDAFAREGLILSETCCPTPHCCPSRATFMSGLYPSRHGIWNNVLNEQHLGKDLKEGVRLWSEDLAAAGYAMHFTGKWHVSGSERPCDRGWTEHDVSGVPGQINGQPWSHFQRLAEAGDPEARKDGEILRPGWGTYRTYGASDDHAHDERCTAHAVDLLPKLTAQNDPWCLYVGLIGPHDPYFAPQEFLDLYDPETIPLPPSYSDRMRDKPGLYQRMRDQIWGQLTEREVREAIRHFWAYCSYLDHLFGQILDTLDRSGQAENTIVVYCSDHGDYCGDHGLFCKSIPCFEGAYHVPAVIRWPKGLKNPGRRSEAFASLADFAPTFREAAGLTGDRACTGRSLLPILRDETPTDWRDAVFTQCDGVEVYATQRSVRTRTHKLVYNAFDRDELYDLTLDPHEMQNVAADPAYEQVKRDLYRRLWQFACSEDDSANNAYITIALAEYGPAEAFRAEAVGCR